MGHQGVGLVSEGALTLQFCVWLILSHRRCLCSTEAVSDSRHILWEATIMASTISFVERHYVVFEDESGCEGDFQLQIHT